jgi:hypothetical protein
MSTPQVDEATVRQFIELIHGCADQAINGSDPGLLQLVQIHPLSDGVSVTRYHLGDVDRMAEDAIAFANAGHNVYAEGRTVRAGLRGNKRGGLQDTAWVFALVIDSDADKGKAWTPTEKATITVETSPGNFHYWFCFSQALTAEQGKRLGDQIRKNSGADQDTGVVTQCYRVAGTPNFPGKAKQQRGRISVEATRITELGKAAPASVPPQQPPPSAPTSTSDDGIEATLPDELLETIRHGGDRNADRSALFHNVVAQLKRRQWSLEAIVALLEKYPTGIAEKFAGRLRKEVERSYEKIDGSLAGASTSPAPGVGPAPSAAPASGGTAGAAPGATAAPSAVPHVLPTIRVVDGQLPRVLEETERALLAFGAAIFSRAGTLVEPVSETMAATNNRQTVVARLRPLCPDSLLELVADSALFQRFNRKRNCWVDIDPPLQLVRMLLAREHRWTF